MSFKSLFGDDKRPIAVLWTIGIVTFCFGIWAAFDGFAIKSNLHSIKGKLRSVNLSTVSVMHKKHKSNKAELVFYLEGINKKFSLSRIIDDEPIDKEYASMKKEFENSDTIRVWIRGSEIDDEMPKVFQIDVDGITILDYDTVRNEKNTFVIITLIGGLIVIAFSIKVTVPVWFKKTFGV
jgi:hypothetical protein